MRFADKFSTGLSFIGTVTLASITLLWAIPASSDDNLWAHLPTRLLEVEGGLVAFQSALIIDTRQPLVNPYFQKYPTKYILPTANESAFSIWVEVEWRIPGAKPFSSFGGIEPGEFVLFWVKTKTPVWDTPIPITATVYADEKKTQHIGGRDVVLQFQGGTYKDHYMDVAKKVNKLTAKIGHAHGGNVEMPVLAGFQEMELFRSVPGTMADTQLMADIQLMLWKNQSRNHWDCTHVVQSVEQIDPRDTANFDTLSDKDKGLIEDGLARGDVNFEEWRIKSCDTVNLYLVLMGSAPTGGTDLMAVDLGEQPP